jgi:cell division topological specificity factor
MMWFVDILLPRRPPSAVVAKDRLKLVLAHERVGRDGADFLPALQRDLVATVRKYVAAREDTIEVRLGKNGSAAILEINIELPPRRKAY